MKTKDWMKIGFGLYLGKWLARLLELMVVGSINGLCDWYITHFGKKDPKFYKRWISMLNRRYGKTVYPEHPGKPEETQNKIGFDIT